MNALLEQEREKLSGIPKQFSWDPSFPPKLLGKPYPKRYEPPKFHPFDGRNGSAVEHVSKFIYTMIPYVGNKELCLREFTKSPVDRAYTVRISALKFYCIMLCMILSMTLCMN